MDPADFLEQSADHIITRYEIYILTGQCSDTEKLKIIKEFVNWCVKEDEKDLIAPRAKDGKSFLQRREENNEHK